MATTFVEMNSSLHQQSSSSTNSPSSNSSGLGDSRSPSLSQFNNSSNCSGNTSLSNHQIEERRALQLAFELLNFNDSINNTAPAQHQTTILNNQHRNSIGSPTHSVMSSLNALSFGSNGNNFVQPPQPEDRSKKSQNTTECVPVPSSEHVAEIVGRQGCKIKALRAKTNTYIKTPVRGEEPVFVVTGRKEDVSKAKKEILSAAEHFSMIRAARKPPALNGLSGAKGGIPPSGPPMNIPGQVTIQIKVPVKIVGLVVGSKGQTIKNIQQQTHTYIVTPSRDKEPVFEVTGLPENVQQCRRQIEAHIALRTGNMSNMMGNSMNGVNGMSGNLLGNNDETVAPDLLQCLYNKGLESLFNYLEPNGGSGDNMSGNNMTNGIDCGQATMSNNCLSNSSLQNGMGMGGCDQFISSNGVTMASSTGSNCSSSASTSSSSSSKSAVMIRPELINIWKSLGESIDCDEGIGESPNIWTLPASNSIIGSRASPSTSASPTDSLLTSNSMKRECLVCGDKEVTAALVPCGHNLFCLDCANRICGPNGDHLCPVCSQIVIQAIRIIA